MDFTKSFLKSKNPCADGFRWYLLAAEGEIRCGPGYGVFAGLCVQSEAWPTSARVTARTPPAGLVSGFWTGQGSGAMEARDAH